MDRWENPGAVKSFTQDYMKSPVVRDKVEWAAKALMQRSDNGPETSMEHESDKSETSSFVSFDNKTQWYVSVPSL